MADEDRKAWLDELLQLQDDEATIDPDDEGYRLLGLVDEPSEPPRRRFGLWLFVVALALVGLAALVLMRSAPDPLETLRTTQAGVLVRVQQMLATEGFVEAVAAYRESPVGPAVFARFCTDAQRGWVQVMLRGLRAVTTEVEALRDVGLAGVGLELVRCENDDLLSMVVAPLEDAVAFYLDGTIGEAEFRARWVDVYN